MIQIPVKLIQFWSQKEDIKNIGGKIKEGAGEKQATSHLMQAIEIAIQQENNQCTVFYL